MSFYPTHDSPNDIQVAPKDPQGSPPREYDVCVVGSYKYGHGKCNLF